MVIVGLFLVFILFTKIVALVVFICNAGFSCNKFHSFGNEDGVSRNCSAGSSCSRKQSVAEAVGEAGLPETVLLVVVVAVNRL